MDNIYIWCSERSKEGAAAISEAFAQLLAKTDRTVEIGAPSDELRFGRRRLSIEVGTRPPKGFQGHVVCWGPAVSKAFRWEDRTFYSIYNDHNKICKFSDRMELARHLSTSDSDIPTVEWISLIPGASISNIHSLLGVGPNTARVAYATTPGGGQARAIMNQSQLSEAISAGLTRAFAVSSQDERTRVFVIRLSPNSFYCHARKIVKPEPVVGDDAFEILSREIATAVVDEKLKEICRRNQVSLERPAYWQDTQASSSSKRIAQRVCEVLNLDFCSVEFSGSSVLSVYTSPSVDSVSPGAVATLADKVIRDVREKTPPKTEEGSKATLQTIAAEATETEAHTILALLERIGRPRFS